MPTSTGTENVQPLVEDEEIDTRLSPEDEYESLAKSDEKCSPSVWAAFFIPTAQLDDVV